MLQEVKDLQNKAVSELLCCFKIKKETTFKAPTGSGKTYMMADFMNEILAEDKDSVFLVSSLSKGDLAEQNYEKFCEYSENGYFSNLKPYLINSETSLEGSIFIPTDYNVYVLPRDLYRRGAKLMENGLEKFLATLSISKQFNGLNKKIYLIKDECHIATRNIDNILNRYFIKKINISATPLDNQIPDVEITEEEAINANLIKRVEFGSEEDSVEVAINKFEEIKQDYRNLLGINPCLIIQISNEEKGEEEFKEILHILNKVEHKDLHWMYIVDSEKDFKTNNRIAQKSPRKMWKDIAKKQISTKGEREDGNIDIIIFKMVITEGWDIPRACMLYQSRKSRSEQLNQQVMGRVRRNPRLLDFETLSNEAKNLAMTAWIWGNVPSEELKNYKVKLCADGCSIQNEIRLKTTRLKNLCNKKDFNVARFLEGRKKEIKTIDIFELYKKLVKSDNFIQEMCYDYTNEDISKWIEFTDNIDAINKESNNYICDYTQSMELTKDDQGNEMEVSMPVESIYLDSNNNIRIRDWIWNREDGYMDFAFDSEAERKWAEILQDLVSINNNEMKEKRAIKSIMVGKRNPNMDKNEEPKYLWGKNYLQNSEIKYEYYLDGTHSSYPDFIMIDSFDRIHIFEVKGLDKSNSLNINEKEYKTKIEELKKCYLQASKLTGHIFYIPILQNNRWNIIRLNNGEENNISEDMFIDFVVGKSN